jgi:Uma2 family endonuclease
MSAHAQPHLTPEEYLEIERAAEFKSEYFNGRMYAMSGGSYPHVRIIGNLTGELHAALRKGPCAVNPNDLRLRVSLGGLYTYPDVTVVCGEPKFADGRKDTLLNPAVIIEVLSPSTEAYDRGFKSTQYRTIESLQEYALVSQNEPRAELYRRQAGGGWLLTESAGLDSSIRFDSIGCQIALADIYEKVTFNPEEIIPARPPVT